MKKVERNKYRKKVNANHKAFALHLHNCPEEPVSEFVNALDDCEFNEKWRMALEPEKEYYHYHPDHLGSSSWITDPDGRPVQHIQYLPFGETWADQRSANWNAPYTFSGKEKDWETSYHYYGARYYDSDLSIWLSIDPLLHRSPHLSPYVYCANNPIILFDPDGRDWVEREVDGVKETYYDRNVKSQADVDKKYGENSGVKHLADGSKVGNGQYTVYNDHENNKNGVMKDANGNVVNNDRNIIYGDGYTLFAGVTDKSVNAETLHGNWLDNSSYIGPNNPTDYDGDDNYDYQPTWSPTEMVAYRHDKAYDAKGASGVRGALSRSTKCADKCLIYECKQIIKNPNTSSFERSRARKMSAVFSGISFIFKTPHR